MHAKKKKGEERRFYSEEDVGYLASGSNEMKLQESEAALAGGLF